MGENEGKGRERDRTKRRERMGENEEKKGTKYIKQEKKNGRQKEGTDSD